MAQWTTTDPGAGDLGEIQTRAAKLAAQREHALDMQQSVRQALGGVAESWSGSGQAAWAAKATESAALWGLLHDRLDGEYQALNRYSADVESIKTRAAQQNAILGKAGETLLFASLDGSENSVTLPGSAPATPDPAVADAHAAVASANGVLASLAAERQDADDRLVASIRSLQDAYAVGAIAVEPASALATSDFERLPLSRRLTALSTLSKTQLEALMKSDPQLAQEFWNNPPDASFVAKWWSGLTDADRKNLIAGAPSVVGNLGGVPYSERVAANEVQMVALAKLSADGRLTHDQQAAYRSLQTALKSAKGKNVPAGTIDLNFAAQPPLAAVAIGDVDAAGKVTWDVSGMGSTVAANMTGWTTAAINLYDRQNFVDKSHSHAVVAWIGYRTPDSPGPTMFTSKNSVFRNDDAAAGSVRLTNELDALNTVRSASMPGGSGISVVGHSYGTTTAADALTKTNFTADSVVFVASAGIDGRIAPKATSLHVASVGGVPKVFETLASADHVAPTGQNYSNRIAPGDGAFGGAQFSSDGSATLNGVQGHDAIGAGADEYIYSTVNFGHGYFDQGTESINNIAAASTGQAQKIVGGLSHATPLDGVIHGIVQAGAGPVGPFLGVR